MKKITGFVTVVALGFNMTVVALGVTVIADVLALDTTPSATIKLSGGSATAGVGVDWGRGTLTHQAGVAAMKNQLGPEPPVSCVQKPRGLHDIDEQATLAVGSDTGNGVLSIVQRR
jgi:hypothetical protein